MSLGLSAGTISLISTGATLLGGAMASKASGKAADSQVAAAQEANALQRQMYETGRADLAPYRDVGYSALDRLRAMQGLRVQNPSSLPPAGMVGAPPAQENASGGRSSSLSPLLGAGVSYLAGQDMPAGLGTVAGGLLSGLFSGSKRKSAPPPQAAAPGVPWTDNAQFSPDQLMQEDPSYQFRLAEGEKGINRSAAAGSGLLSGATLKALSKYNQNFASTEFQSSFNRNAALAGIGQNATNSTNALSSNFGNNAAQLTQNAGDARAAGYVGQANAISGALGRTVNAFQDQQMLDYFRNRGSGGQPSYQPAGSMTTNQFIP